jgi:hypothetical protein
LRPLSCRRTADTGSAEPYLEEYSALRRFICISDMEKNHYYLETGAQHLLHPVRERFQEATTGIMWSFNSIPSRCLNEFRWDL